MQEILVNPKFLRSKGITVHTILQKPGEFIVSAPGVLPCQVALCLVCSLQPNHLLGQQSLAIKVLGFVRCFKSPPLRRIVV